MKRRTFLLSLIAIPLAPVPEPMEQFGRWNPTVRVIHLKPGVVYAYSEPEYVGKVDFTNQPLVGFSKFKDVSMGCMVPHPLCADCGDT